MNRIKRYLASRFFWTGLAIVIQIAVLFYLVLYLGRFSYTVTAYSAFAAVLGFIVFCRDDTPEYRMSWMLVVLIIPILGGMLYLLFGNKRQSEKERMIRHSYQMLETDSRPAPPEGVVSADVLPDPDDRLLAKYIEHHGNGMVFTDSPVMYFSTGDEVFMPFLEELNKAEKFIFMEFFIYEQGVLFSRVFEILKRKVAEGVKVCLMYDDIGSSFSVAGNFDLYLRSFGIQAVCFNPMRPSVNPRLNYRDHRKMCIIDGNTVISGGLNIADEYVNRIIRFGHWKDNAFIIRGSGVWNYTLMFIRLWNFSCPDNYAISNFNEYAPTVRYPVTGGFIQSYGDSPLSDDRVAENAFLTVINNARKYVWISTPYLILDSAMQDALILASKSGVDVRIITPAIPDKKIVFEVTRSNYYRLVENGVSVFEYLPGFIHSKMFVSDDSRAIVGTTNMDFRSFFLHFECSTVFYGGKIIEDVKNDFLRTFDYCRQVPADYRQTVSRPQRIFRGLIRAVAPML